MVGSVVGLVVEEGFVVGLVVVGGVSLVFSVFSTSKMALDTARMEPSEGLLRSVNSPSIRTIMVEEPPPSSSSANFAPKALASSASFFTVMPVAPPAPLPSATQTKPVPSSLKPIKVRGALALPELSVWGLVFTIPLSTNIS